MVNIVLNTDRVCYKILHMDETILFLNVYLSSWLMLLKFVTTMNVHNTQEHLLQNQHRTNIKES